MVRDEYIRQARAANEPKPKAQPKDAPKVGIGGRSGPASKSDPSRVRASSSSSSSSSTSAATEEKHPAKKQRDERLDHPALAAVLEIRGAYPPKDLWNLVIEKVGVNPDSAKLKECWLEWRTRGYSPVAYGWLLDWYLNGNMPTNGRGLAGKSKTESSLAAAERVAAKYGQRS
jgi:hypothetical protein